MRGHEEPVLLAAKEMRMGSSESELNVGLAITQRGDHDDARHVVTHDLFVVRYVERTHQLDVIGPSPFLVAHQRDHPAASRHQAVLHETFEN
jgi:hypothetical protein